VDLRYRPDNWQVLAGMPPEDEKDAASGRIA
jgi:hypothetical protein